MRGNTTKKTLAITALAAASTLALAGCSAGGTEPEAAASTTLPGASGTPSAEPSPPSTADPEQIKADAIASGRPEAAWDIDCIAWELPEASTDEQLRANHIAQTWLDAHEAGCPDAITFPWYYVEAFLPTDDGGVEVVLDAKARAEEYIKRDSDQDLQSTGFGVFETLEDASVSLPSVTVSLDGTDRSFRVTPEQVEGGVLTAD
ncbi:hypothetical protein [Zhihengliuella halotolerans]|uniref:hypothetical protein n=1 Tax=Zhihengliuella halotolerans TaxID=370736 RepID=UPI000C80E715|nr:hypothetical protein [Zhihengliuella halotolerans]